MWNCIRVYHISKKIFQYKTAILFQIIIYHLHYANTIPHLKHFQILISADQVAISTSITTLWAAHKIYHNSTNESMKIFPYSITTVSGNQNIQNFWNLVRFHETCLKKYFYLKSNAVYDNYSNNIIYETNLVQNIITGIINWSQLQCTRLQSSVIE